MPNNINLTVELGTEDRARLDKIIDLLGKVNVIGGVDFAPAKEVEKVDVLKDEPKPEPEPTVTLEEVRLLVQKLATPSSGKRDAVRGIVMKYAKSVSDIPADKLTDVYTELVALDKGA